jgi:autotransporter-associated beta strand protein
MKKLLLAFAMLLGISTAAMAQRFTDKLDRGLVAVPAGSGNFISWRRQADEYYDVTYSLYKNGELLKSGLTVTNYTDTGGGSSSTYEVEAYVKGNKKADYYQSYSVGLWSDYAYKYAYQTHNGYIDIELAPVYNRKGIDITSHYSPNDAELADLDGDGQLDIIIKRLNTVDAAGYDSGYDDANGKDRYLLYPKNSEEFSVIDAYHVNWSTGEVSLLWRIDCGPNMVSHMSTELNIIAFDWDEDGKAEVVLRGADNMIVYDSDGNQLYTIGDMTVNTRNDWYTTNKEGKATGSMAYTNTGAEYLIYMNGATGAYYQITDYPLKRLEDNETNLEAAWGDGYGHRSSKYFFGAPFLDGRHASLFLGRGIYTRHKMIAMDLNTDTHEWSERWRWNCNNSSSPWYGNGYHNYIIADVDEDGCDEIVYGSMVIDDNGYGLSTTGYGHGDAEHVSDFDPYRKGLEFFGCLEEKKANYGSNYRNATTSDIYYKHDAGSDDGRALCANLSNNYPGCFAQSASSSIISTTSDKLIDGLGAMDSYLLNFRIYWDGDLCSETLTSKSDNGWAMIDKYGTGRIFTSNEHVHLNNGSKDNACFVGDIIGDWREEMILTNGQNIRVFTTGIPTNYSMPCLWYDHQYRQAMVWQMMAYNQPPHLSYFLGEMEGITVAPPPLTMEGRTEIEDGSSITSSNNSEHVLLCDASSVGIEAGGVSPQVITVNVNSIVSGNGNNDNIDYSYNATQLGNGNGKGDITGSTRLVKQGDGLLKLTAREFSYSGNTDIWGGTLRFRGTFKNSDVWMNRHTSFFSGATISKSLTMEYGSTLYPTNGDVSDASVASYGTTTIGTLNLHEGARIVMQMDPDNSQYDQVNIGTLNIRTQTGDAWENYGPEYLQPVMEFCLADGSLNDGAYKLGNVGTVADGDIDDIILEGLDGVDNPRLDLSNGELRLLVGNGISTTCAEADITESGSWQANNEGILMPVVDVTANTFTYGNEEVTPTLSATFTDQDNNTEDVSLYRTLYKEDYEDATDASDWTTANAVPTLVTDDVTYGSYSQINQGGGGGNRSAYKRIFATGSNIYGNCTNYAIEFDAKIHYTYDSNNNTHDNQLILYGEGASMPASNATFLDSETNYLFKLTGGRQQGVTYTVAADGAAYTYTDAAWYHYSVTVDKESRSVNYTITSGNNQIVGTGTYVLDANVSPNIQGVFVSLGRYNSYIGIDNIHIYTLGYAFTEPGTLTVTSSYPGCADAETTYECDYIGAEIGASGWSTLGCNYPLDLSGSGLPTAYVVSELNSGYAKLKQVTGAPASTGLLLEGSKGIYQLPITSNASSVGTNLLTAVTDADGYPVNNNTTYVLANTAASGTGFYQGQQGLVIPAGKAYLTVPAGSREVILIGEATGIDNAARLMNSGNENSAVYNLNGQRLQAGDPRLGMLPLRKGIYIVGGQKIVIK